MTECIRCSASMLCCAATGFSGWVTSKFRLLSLHVIWTASSVCPVQLTTFKWPQRVRILSGWNEYLFLNFARRLKSPTEGGVHLVHSMDTSRLLPLRIFLRCWVRRPANPRCNATILSDEASWLYWISPARPLFLMEILYFLLSLRATHKQVNAV